MSSVTFSRIGGKRLTVALGVSALLTVMGLAATWQIEEHGHYITGMSNAVPWGISLALATFCIVAASGALNVASIASVFGKEDYKSFSRLSCLLALGLLAGGLFTLLIDLGRPDQIFTALTNFNFTSVFAVNILVYTGFFVIVGSYGLVMLVGPQSRILRPVGITSFIWRLIMTTGTGSVFGVLAGRGGMHSAVMPPLFIALSLSVGLAVFILVLSLLECVGNRKARLDATASRLGNLLVTLIAVTFYMVLAQNLIGVASPATRGYEAFVLCSGGEFPLLFWGGFLLLGTVLPLCLLLVPQCRGNRACLLAAAWATVAGGMALMYVLVIAPQAYPPDLFPGMLVKGDALYAAPASYTPTLGEIAAGLTGFGLAGLAVLLGARIFPLLPKADPDD